ncbi:hypothetical protein NMG60_11023627 [Bertholletia excelsa]
MAGICCLVNACPTPKPSGVDGFLCCFNAPNENKKATTSPTPQILKIAVNGVTELLRIFVPANERLDSVNYVKKKEVIVSSIDDVVRILKEDYGNSYFVTGMFTSAVYSEDCLFEDPTIRFRGTELYSRNLKLLLPFFDSPSIALQKIEKGMNAEMQFVVATWKLRTFLRLPWRPFISVNGSTTYDLDDRFKIVRHAESWDISALQAVGQIFTSSSGRPSE